MSVEGAFRPARLNLDQRRRMFSHCAPNKDWVSKRHKETLQSIQEIACATSERGIIYVYKYHQSSLIDKAAFVYRLSILYNISASSESYIMSAKDETQYLPQLSEETLSDIRELSTRCKELLRELSTHEGARAIEFIDSFNDWAAIMGVFGEGQQSIAYRLRSAPGDITMIQKVLKALIYCIKKALPQREYGEGRSSDRESNVSSSQSCDIEKALPRREYGEGSSSDRDSSVSSCRSSVSSCRVRPYRPSKVSDAAPLSRSFPWESIDGMIKTLHITLIRQQAVNRLGVEGTKRSERNNEELYRLFEDCARQKVDHLYPKASTILQERITQSVATRYLNLELHQKKISTSAEAVPSLQTEPGPMRVDQAQAASPSSMIHDFESFFCVLDSCSSPFNCANTYTGLLAHMREVHTQPRWQCWHCQTLSPTSCSFLTSKELEEHIKDVHREEVAESSRSTVVKPSMLHDQPVLQECPFCGGYPEELEKKYTNRDCKEARNALEKHVEQHFIIVALISDPTTKEHRQDNENDDENSAAQRDDCSEIDLDEIDAIHALKCPDDACDCKDTPLDYPIPDDDPSYKDNVDIQNEWKFMSDGKARQDTKFREYFQLETLSLTPGPKEALEGKEQINDWGIGSQLISREANQNVVTEGMLIPRSISQGVVTVDVEREKSRAETLLELRGWLLGSQMADEQYNNAIHQRLQNTCDWILHSREFQVWRRIPASIPRILWIHGPQGFGKTVLCARIIEHIKNMKQETVAYHFFSSDLESYKDPMEAMRSWVYQMAEKNESIASIVNRTRQSGPASQTIVIELFRQAIKMVQNCTLVIDGLDECISDSSNLAAIEFFREISETAQSTNTRILVMSRFKPSIHEALMAANAAEFSEHEVSREDVRSDIDAVSKDIVTRKLKAKDTIVQERMVRNMSDRSNGQFLWLRLQQNSLPEGLSEMQFLRALEEAPDGLESDYARHLYCVKQLPENDRTRAFSLLRLVAFSLRPLTVREISEAVLVSEGHEDFPIHQLPDQWDEQYVKERILDLCYSLLETRMQTLECPVEEWTVHFVNISAKEHFLQDPLHENSSNPGFPSMAAIQNTNIAKLCITYLGYSYAWQSPHSAEAPHLGSFTRFAAKSKFWNKHVEAGAPHLGSFTGYAANFWNKHVEAGAPHKTILEKMDKFFDEDSPSWTKWRNWFDSTYGWTNANFGPAIPLCYAIELGLVDLALAIINKGERRVNYDSGCRTALGVASSKGFEQLARELLAHGAKVGTRDADGRTAIYYAAINGHSEVVKLLVDNGADVNLQDDNGESPFLAASANGHVDTMRLLINEYADFDKLDKEGNSALSKAISNRHLAAVQLLLRIHVRDDGLLLHFLTAQPNDEELENGPPDLIQLLSFHQRDLNVAKHANKRTLVHFACFWGRTDLVKLLVDRGADLTLQDLWGQTPLFFACANGHTEIVRFLLQNKADPAVATHDKQTPLFVACGNGHFDIVKLLLEHGANHAVAAAGTGQTPLIAACCTGDIEVVRLLIKSEVNIMTPDEEGKTPLHAACANGHFPVARLLIFKGADLIISDTFGNSILSAAAFGGSLAIVQLLLERGNHIARSDCDLPILIASERGWIDIVRQLVEWNRHDIKKADIMNAALSHASGSGQIDVVAFLLKCGADLNSSSPYGQTPLYEACCIGRIEVIKFLIEKGADVSAAGEMGQTPLMGACAYDLHDLALLLLQKGADLHALDSDGMNAAYAAACNGHLRVLRLLLSWGANISSKSKTGWLPIHAASLKGHYEIVDELIEHGSDASRSNVDGNTPLILATTNRHINVVMSLLEHGAKIDAKDAFGQTSLSIASREGDNEIAKLLVDNRAIISIADDEGRTPLFFASSNGHLDIVRLLLDNGADMTPNNKGQTPEYMASANGHSDVLRLFGNTGAVATAPGKRRQTPSHASTAAIDVHMVISDLITIVRHVKNKYDALKDNMELGGTFHVAARQLPLIEEALRKVKPYLPTPDVPRAVIASLDSCKTTTASLGTVFNELAMVQADERRECYAAIVQKKGLRNWVEFLIDTMMRQVHEVMQYYATGEDMEEQRVKLETGIENLRKMARPVPVEQQRGGHQFAMYSGVRYKATGNARKVNSIMFYGGTTPDYYY